MTTATVSKPKTILTTKFTSDGTAKVSLVLRELAKLNSARDLCDLLVNVPSMTDEAKAARDAIDTLMEACLPK